MRAAISPARHGSGRLRNERVDHPADVKEVPETFIGKETLRAGRFFNQGTIHPFLGRPFRLARSQAKQAGAGSQCELDHTLPRKVNFLTSSAGCLARRQRRPAPPPSWPRFPKGGPTLLAAGFGWPAADGLGAASAGAAAQNPFGSGETGHVGAVHGREEIGRAGFAGEEQPVADRRGQHRAVAGMAGPA